MRLRLARALPLLIASALGLSLLLPSTVSAAPPDGSPALTAHEPAEPALPGATPDAPAKGGSEGKGNGKAKDDGKSAAPNVGGDAIEPPAPEDGPGNSARPDRPAKDDRSNNGKAGADLPLSPLSAGAAPHASDDAQDDSGAPGQSSSAGKPAKDDKPANDNKPATGQPTLPRFIGGSTASTDASNGDAPEQGAPESPANARASFLRKPVGEPDASDASADGDERPMLPAMARFTPAANRATVRARILPIFAILDGRFDAEPWKSQPPARPAFVASVAARPFSAAASGDVPPAASRPGGGLGGFLRANPPRVAPAAHSAASSTAFDAALNARSPRTFGLTAFGGFLGGADAASTDDGSSTAAWPPRGRFGFISQNGFLDRVAR